MKILLCTPYKRGPEYVFGGMVMWGANILRYAASMKNAGIKIIPVSFDRTNFVPEGLSRISRIVIGIKELSRPIIKAALLMKRHKVDCIHICTSASMSFLKDIVLLKIACKYKIKSIVHFHYGRTPEVLKTTGWENYMLKKVMKLADKVITMNSCSYNALKIAGYTNVVNIPNPLSMEIVQLVKNMEGRYKRIPNRILYVGHIIQTKGVYELIEACSKIRGIELRLVGRVTDMQKNELRKLAGENVDNWCHFIGEINHNQVLEEFFQAGLFVFPSYAEGFPNVILEAMACGCPIASSAVGAIPEILDIAGDACGVCYEPRQASEVENAILTLIFDENRKSFLATKAKQRVYNKYTMPDVWRQLVEMWKSELYV